MAAGVALLGVNEVGELGGVTDEENGSVVEDPIPVSLAGAQLDGEATGIARGIGTTRLATDSGETDGGAHLRTDVAQNGGGGDISERVRQLEVAMSTSALGMDLRGG